MSHFFFLKLFWLTWRRFSALQKVPIQQAPSSQSLLELQRQTQEKQARAALTRSIRRQSRWHLRHGIALWFKPDPAPLPSSPRTTLERLSAYHHQDARGTFLPPLIPPLTPPPFFTIYLPYPLTPYFQSLASPQPPLETYLGSYYTSLCPFGQAFAHILPTGEYTALVVDLPSLLNPWCSHSSETLGVRGHSTARLAHRFFNLIFHVLHVHNPSLHLRHLYLYMGPSSRTDLDFFSRRESNLYEDTYALIQRLAPFFGFHLCPFTHLSSPLLFTLLSTLFHDLRVHTLLISENPEVFPWLSFQGHSGHPEFRNREENGIPLLSRDKKFLFIPSITLYHPKYQLVLRPQDFPSLLGVSVESISDWLKLRKKEGVGVRGAVMLCNILFKGKRNEKEEKDSFDLDPEDELGAQRTSFGNKKNKRNPTLEEARLRDWVTKKWSEGPTLGSCLNHEDLAYHLAIVTNGAFYLGERVEGTGGELVHWAFFLSEIGSRGEKTKQ